VVELRGQPGVGIANCVPIGIENIKSCHAGADTMVVAIDIKIKAHETARCEMPKARLPGGKASCLVNGIAEKWFFHFQL